MIAESWRAARSSVPPGHLDAAGCNVPSDRTLDAVVGHLRHEREVGGYRAVPDLHASRAALAALVGAGADDVALLESGTAAMAALLGGWPLPPGSRVGVTRAEYGSTLMLLYRLARLRDWKLLELPVDDDSRLDPGGLASMLAGGLDLVVLSHISSHRGVVQPAAAVGRLCRAAGVPLVLDVCQSLGHVDTGGAGATAYVGTSRKWLAGPRGVGFLIVPGLAGGMDAAAPALGGHEWARGEAPALSGHGWVKGETPALGGQRIRGEAPALSGHGWVKEEVAPLAGAARYETSEGPIAARAGFGVAVLEHRALGPAAVHAHLVELGVTARRLLDGIGGWRAGEPLDEPSAIVTLRPPTGVDPEAAVEDARSRAAEASLLIGTVPVGRAPADLPTPVLRISPSPGAYQEDLHALARVLDR
ncbi:ergothioneine biosynthesis PLP-dependent enzyme EgtE [Streptosporangium roseum]|uniref:ergothioneine biosynthesis PLP-dependent enzyme EgtE n=1 Tax=Streptosporangium roseum TaxID=2001 RepID=UPI0004CD7DB9|nr:ergothioneine biosynthesis PLP-dependent enzyme EgtE [Streptosporangium roseum]